MQETLRCEAADAAGRILTAIEAGGVHAIECALDRSAEACRGPWADSYAAERAELLAAVVESVRGALPLLKHLAAAT
jgi:hypothetical protein